MGFSNLLSFCINERKKEDLLGTKLGVKNQFQLLPWPLPQVKPFSIFSLFHWIAINQPYFYLYSFLKNKIKKKKRRNNGEQPLKILRETLGYGIAVTALNASLYTVDGGQRAVIFDRVRGVMEETVGEGTHFLIPWLQKPFIFDIRTRHYSFSSVSGTKDLQMVHLSLRVMSRPQVDRLPYIFRHLGLEYDEKVLPSTGNEVLKAVVAQFNADQLLTERPRVSALVRESLIKRAAEFNIILDDVAITHLSYGDEFSRAVELKQVAQQEAERSRFVVMKADQERRAAVIRAEGESEAAKLISEATAAAGMGLIELRRIEASKEIAATLSKDPNIAYLPGGQQALLAINPAAVGGR